MSDGESPEIPSEQNGIPAPDEGSPKTLSRREFLGVAGTGTTATLLAIGLGKSRYLIDWISGKPEAKEQIRLSIDMADYVTVEDESKPNEVTLNFTRLSKHYPFLIGGQEGEYFLKNKQQDNVELSFDNLGGKHIKIPPNKTTAAKSNIPLEAYQQKDGYGQVNAGLVMEGNFSVSFDRKLARKPTLVGYGLDRILMFKGNSPDSRSSVEGLKFQGLNDFRQVDGGQDTPAPAYISADNTHLVVQASEISHQAKKPEAIDEVNSQLARGIISQNTNKQDIKLLAVKSTKIKGLLWDGIVANGVSKIWANDCNLQQAPTYRERRGVAIATTHNTNAGQILVEKSAIDYNKGITNFTEDDTPSAQINLKIVDSQLKVGQWASIFKQAQNSIFENNEINLTKGSQEQLPTDVEITSWDQVPMGHILALDSPENTISLKNIKFTFHRGVGDLINLVTIQGGVQALKNPQGYIDNNLAKIGPIKAHDYNDIDPFGISLTGEGLANIVKRAIKEPNLYPTTVMIVYKRHELGKHFGVIVEDLSNWQTKPSKIFWFKPVRDQPKK